MKTKHHLVKSERGQIVPIVVFGMLAMLAMAALILDGGAVILNRRSAQNAADASAMAGARVLCRGDNPTTATIYNAIYQYASVENQAAIVDWEITAEGLGEVAGLAVGEVVVTVEVAHGSFFAKIFNQDTLSAQATAGAGCFSYAPSVVLPIAYPCRPPAAGSESEDCDYVPLDWSEIMAVVDDYDYDPKSGNPTDLQSLHISNDLFADYQDQIYIVMDEDLVCGKDHICHFSEEDEGRYQLNSSQRGWLNLEGINPSTTSIRKWVNEGVSDELHVHTWLSFIQGNKTPGYTALHDRLDEIVWVPVFNYLCDYEPVHGTVCHEEAHLDFPLAPGQECRTDQIFQNHYPVAHVVAYAPFFPTCVQLNGEATFYNKHTMDKEYENCPGFVRAQEINPDPKNPDKSTIKDNTNALEGYFIQPDSLPGDWVSTGGADLGIYVVSLTR